MEDYSKQKHLGNKKCEYVNQKQQLKGVWYQAKANCKMTGYFHNFDMLSHLFAPSLFGTKAG